MSSEQVSVSYDFVSFLILKLWNCGESLCSTVSAKPEIVANVLSSEASEVR